MPLLSRVGETFYWFGRYVERAENTARLILAYSNLALDLPRRSRLEWVSMVDITGASENFADSAHNPTELGVMRFMIADPDNPGSIRSSLKLARENLRITRDRVPREVSEAMNALYAVMADESEGAIRRTAARHAFLRNVINHCQIVRGYLGGAMSHGLGYQFIRAGRMLERADMTTRIMDVRMEALLPDEADLPAAFDALQWMAVLRSLSAYQMYRREHHGPVKARYVIDFLLNEEQFPRAVQSCVVQTYRCISRLPRSEEPLATIRALLDKLQNLRSSVLSSDKQMLRITMDDLQQDIHTMHNTIARTYFSLGAPEA